MMLPPSIARIRIADEGRGRVNLWLPLILIWPVLLALGVVLAPLVLIAALATWSRYGRMLLYGGPQLFVVLCALRGLRVQVADGRDQVCIYFL
ncbi:MAG: hypothetical protein ACYDCO_21460 [Armatimonadota bacterium]